MLRTAPQLTLVLLAAGVFCGSHLFAAAAKNGVKSEGANADDSDLGSVFQMDSGLKTVKDQVAIRRHAHNSEGRTTETTYRALQQKMRAGGQCETLYADKFHTYNAARAQEELAKQKSNFRPPASGAAVPSMLQTAVSASANLTGIKANIVGTGAYDPEHEIVHVGVSIIGPPSDCLAGRIVRMCWCTSGVYLHVDDWHYKVTSIMHKGESLCMGGCNMGPKISQMVAGAGGIGRTLIVQVEDIPNLPFGISVEAVTHWADGMLEAQVRFTETTQGVVLPGWVCIKCCDAAPMTLLAAGAVLGCIHDIRTSAQTYPVGQTIGQHEPSFRMVKLGDRTYTLPNYVPDQTVCLARDVKQLLQGGDAIVNTCPAR